MRAVANTAIAVLNSPLLDSFLWRLQTCLQRSSDHTCRLNKGCSSSKGESSLIDEQSATDGGQLV